MQAELLNNVPQAQPATPDEQGVWARLLFFMNPIDGRYEDLKKGNLKLNLFRDFMAGLIVTMVAIPLAMGFAMASARCFA